MATSGQIFLRLPSSLRQHILLQEPAQFGQLLRGRHCISLRTFYSTPPKFDRRRPSKALSKQASPTPPQPLPASIPWEKASRASPPAAAEVLNVDRKPITVLLYTSTNHGAFFASSIILGSAFIIGGYLYAQTVLKDTLPDGTKQTAFFKMMGALSVLPAVGFGTLFVLAPQKMIRSIAVVSKEPTVIQAVAPVSRLPRTLRIEIKRIMPFVKPDVIEVTTDKVALDRNVPMVLEDLAFKTVAKENGLLWTEEYFAGRIRHDSGPKGVLASVKAIFPGVSREIRRMFLRDQMARMSIENNGTFKLDLRNCCMLEEGRALHEVTGRNVMEDMSLISRLRSLVKK